jgi:RNA polymerase sigma-70 factor (ECF subfamily)
MSSKDLGKGGARGRLKLVGRPAESPEQTRRGEAERLRDAAAGDEDAVRWLFRAHVDRIHRTVGRILGRHDPDVEDVVQQTFLAALRGAPGFDGRSALSTWLIGIATRRALDQARARWRRRRWQRVQDLVGLGRPASRPDVRSAALEEAHAALEALSPDQRTVFVLHEVEGHTLEEIKEMTGVGVSTLHARLKSARKKLDHHVGSARSGGGDHGNAA